VDPNTDAQLQIPVCCLRRGRQLVVALITDLEVSLGDVHLGSDGDGGRLAGDLNGLTQHASLAADLRSTRGREQQAQKDDWLELRGNDEVVRVSKIAEVVNVTATQGDRCRAQRTLMRSCRNFS
jgi:hypothetical protein